MAREFAQIKLSIWGDQDFTSLTAEQQLVYLMLSSQPTINLAGVLDYLPGRFARLSGGLTAAKVGKIIEQLEAHDFVFLDEDTDEILVRSLIRTSGAWKTPNSAQAIALNTQQVMSRKLKSVLLTELHRVVQEAMAAGQWEKSRTVLATCAATLERDGINPWAKGSRMGSPNPSLKGLPGEGEGDGDVREGERSNGDLRSPACAHDKKADSPEFTRFWDTYPRKTNKGAARTAWANALHRADAHTIIDGAHTYATDPNLPVDQTKIPHASTWLNNDRWEDGPQPERLDHLTRGDLTMRREAQNALTQNGWRTPTLTYNQRGQLEQ